MAYESPGISLQAAEVDFYRLVDQGAVTQDKIDSYFDRWGERTEHDRYFMDNLRRRIRAVAVRDIVSLIDGLKQGGA